jgi:8-amino-7-oxononanoate synthase
VEQERQTQIWPRLGYSPLVNLDDEFRRELADLSAQHRLRETRSLRGFDRAHPTASDGSQLVSFCSNDYLGLAGHPSLAAAAATEVLTAGFGASASRLVSGEGPSHQSLEAVLAAMVELPSALLFPTGYLTNIGVITALAGPADLIVSDAANHASIIDGCRLTRARVVVFPHLDPTAAEEALAATAPFRRRFLVTESLFSMNGDRAPLPSLATIATKQGAALIVDEAHALGTIGLQGRGLCAELGIRPTVLIGTLGKAFASLGGFAAGSAHLRDLLVNKARSFIYSTATPPHLAAAAQEAVALSRGEYGASRRQRAYAMASHIRRELRAIGISAPGQDLIIPVVIGNDRDCLQVAAALLERKLLVPAIRPPTVPEGSARLRITVSAAHDLADAERLLDALRDLLPRPRAD